MRYILPIGCAALVSWGAFSWWNGRPLDTPPGVLVADEPVQQSCPPQQIAQVKDYTLTAVATYAMRARVLHTKRYWADGNDLVPYDVALGWGPMSDRSILDQLEISQGNRFFFYQWQNAPPISEREIMKHAANTHLIAANRTVARAISRLRAGQIVTLRGYLVNVSKPDGFHWNTSTTREDTGNGACELIYVEEIKAGDPSSFDQPEPAAVAALR